MAVVPLIGGELGGGDGVVRGDREGWRRVEIFDDGLVQSDFATVKVCSLN